MRTRTSDPTDAGRHTAPPALRIVLRALLAALVIVPVIALPAVEEAGASPLFSETFRGNGTASSSGWVRGGTGFTPCLTASGGSTGTIQSCTGASDPAGSGALRLTGTGTNQAGYVLWNSPLAASAGLDISFRQFQWGGTGADGISFFLTDGAQNLSSPGATGGSLGYHNSSAGVSDGLAHALLGIGLDAYGNFPIQVTNAGCSSPSGADGDGRFPDSVSVRGPGNGGGSNAYCVLGSPSAVSGLRGSTRASSEHLVRIKVDPGSSSPQVTVWIDGTQVIQVARPNLTSTFKFGFAASTGTSTDVHEIRDLQVETVTTLNPVLSGGVTGPSSAVGAGTSFTSTVTSGLTTAGGGVGSGDQITMTITSPGGFSGTPSGDGWTCPTPGAGATTATCTRPGGGGAVPGTTFPPVTVPAKADTSSGASTVSATLSAPGATPLVQSSPSFTVNPVAQPHEVRIASSASPVAEPIPLPTPTGTGPFTWSIVSAPPVGAASFPTSSVGTVSYTPPANRTTPVSFTYRVADGGGRQSDPATVTVRFSVEGPPVSGSTTASNAVTFAGPTLPGNPTVSTRSFATSPGSAGTAAWVGDQLQHTPAAGFSGTAAFRYLITDTSGTEWVGEVTVTVAPRLSAPGAITVDQDADGTASGTGAVQTTVGVGPHTYSIVTQPASGTATIDPSTGAVTYQATGGSSGTDSLTIEVTSAGGTSAPATVPVTVRPWAAPVSGTTSTGSTVVLDPPDVVGTGPFTYAIATPPGSGAMATIAADGALVIPLPSVTV